jgi:2-oxoglutarate ferredoxin oxidoreductase subunit delta
MSRIVIDEVRCKGCGLCTLVCPYNLVRIAERFNDKGYRPAELADADGECIGCANCATMCPDVAITVYRSAKQRADVQRAAIQRAVTQGAAERQPEREDRGP